MAQSVSGFNRAIRALHQQCEGQIAKNKEISRKINELEQARSLMSQAKSKSEDLRNNVKRVKLEERWKGNLREEMEQKQDANMSRSQLIINGIDKGISEINSHIWKLRLEYDYIAGLIGKLESSIEATTREKNRFIAEANARKASGGR